MGSVLRQLEPATAKRIRRSIHPLQRKNRVAGSVKLSETQTMITVCKFIASPVGALELVARRDGLAAILWENDAPNRVRLG